MGRITIRPAREEEGGSLEVWRSGGRGQGTWRGESWEVALGPSRTMKGGRCVYRERKGDDQLENFRPRGEGWGRRKEVGERNLVEWRRRSKSRLNAIKHASSGGLAQEIGPAFIDEEYERSRS